ncbi:MAG: DNA/RNA non-specific endonuclease, partial [Ferruginibacter sp.]
VVSLYEGVYGSEASSDFELWASVNGGTTWSKVGSGTASAPSLTKVSFGMNYYGNVRFQVRKIGGGQLNIDDINILSNSSTATRDNNLSMGNISSAITSTANPDNYLLERSQYTLSYNNSRGSANWVSWQLNTAWKGSIPRCDCFMPDTDLPASFFKATTTDYSGTGFDRGHLCPSDDRDLTSDDNAATFLMDNIIPQAPNLNQVPWSNLENYCRTLIGNGYELFIMAGGYGNGGTGSMGGVTNTIGLGQITVPARNWKVIVVLTVGSNDAMRVSAGTRVIAVDMPNTQTASSQSWGSYRVSVNALQGILGYDFLSNVSPAIQNVIESTVDNGPTN